MNTLKTLALALVLVVGGVIGNLALAGGTSQASVPNILEFDTMAPVTGPYVGTANPIREVNGGGLPWRINSARGELTTTGHVEVSVRGLVLTPTGANPAPTFRAIVNCQSIDATGNPLIVNVPTGEFPATTTGNANIEANLSLPHPCIGPIVFVTNAGGRWFAVTGN